MKDHVRAAMAAAAIAHSTGRSLSSVYDYSASKHRRIQASVQGETLRAHDYDVGAQISGTMPRLYHYGEGCHLDLKANGTNTYRGYDYGSSCHFDVRVSGNSAQIYDFGESRNYQYSS